MSFVHLQVMSHYSLLQTTTSLEDLVRLSKEKGYQAIALTDYNYLYGQLDFFKLCKKYKIKPIIGVQLELPGIIQTDREFPLVMLAKNDKGYKSLMALSTLKSKDDMLTFKRKLQEGVADLIVITPGETGEIEWFLKQNELEKAQEIAFHWKKIFKKEQFFLGIQVYKNMQNLILPLKQLGERVGIPTIAMGDVRYLNTGDYFSTKVLQAIGKGEQIEIKEETLTGEHYLREAIETLTLFSKWDLEKEAAMTVKVAEMIHVNIPLHQNLLPRYPIPKETTTQSYLKALCSEGLKNRVPDAGEEYLIRLDYELSVIHDMGFDDYFLIVWDVMDYARRKKILPGAGRGSAAGSLVAYALNITHVDPIQYALLFERFLNKARYTLPDIDLDFPDDRRDEVLHYVQHKYGEDHVAQIITFGTLATKMSLRDTARVFGLTTQEAGKWSAAIPNQLGINLKESLRKSSSLQKLIEESPKNKLLFETALKIEGSPRHVSTHAAGVVISDRSLVDLIPLQYREGELLLTQYPMGNVEEIGLLKMDFLGLKNLTILNNAIQLAEQQANTSIDVFALPTDDQKTMNLFKRADTNGIFQFESPGIRNVLRRLGPENIEDLVAVNALYRPGPMEQIEAFINRKKGREAIVYPHPNLEPILKVTYGIMVYQEQVMQVASKLAGFTLGEADILRRAIGKKHKEAIDQERDHFITGALENGYDQSTAVQVYDYIERFANYGFNRSHSVAYSFIAYQMAYMKTHYPVAFFAALLNSINPHSDKMNDYILDIKKHQLETLHPDINESFWGFSVQNGKIQFGLGSIKGLRRDFIQAILKERKASGPYQHFVQFLRRLPDKWLKPELVEPLIFSGVFDSFGYNRATLCHSLPGMLTSIAYSGNNIGLFQVLEPKYIMSEELPPVQLAEKEEEYLGFSLRGHPIDAFDYLYAQEGLKYISELKDSKSEQTMGLLKEIKRIQTKKGDAMAFLTVTDSSGVLSVTVFPELYRRYLKVLREGHLLVLNGKLDVKRGKEHESFIVKSIIELEDFVNKSREKSKKCYIRLTAENKNQFENVGLLLKKNPGETPVIVVDTISNRTILMDKTYCFNYSEEVARSLELLVGKSNLVLK